ncbi:hypothetical protein EYF80_052835 [Liparis tanakae]|uniref:Uncharacterized protein n=1 Tax=Liparis tanakae TaxID=230148 RepID=A0A4Z2F7M2_9TELE|nr:hypothetical protein EYF80_052835 [Liparis tanakae]
MPWHDVTAVPGCVGEPPRPLTAPKFMFMKALAEPAGGSAGRLLYHRHGDAPGRRRRVLLLLLRAPRRRLQGLVLPLPLALVAAVLEPDLHLVGGELQGAGQVLALRRGQVALLLEAPLQLEHLRLGEEDPRPAAAALLLGRRPLRVARPGLRRLLPGRQRAALWRGEGRGEFNAPTLSLQLGPLQSRVHVHVRGHAGVPPLLLARRQRPEVGQAVLSVREGRAAVPGPGEHAGRRGLELPLPVLELQGPGLLLAEGPVLELQGPGLLLAEGPVLELQGPGLLLLQLQDVLDRKRRGGERAVQHHVLQLRLCSAVEMKPTE